MKEVIKRTVFFILITFVGIWIYSGYGITGSSVKIGYFDGGRSHLFYRAYINGYFDDVAVDVEFYTKYLHRDGFYKVPRSYEEMQEEKTASGEDTYFGKVTGAKIIKAIEQGILDAGTVGESSFVYAITNGSPIVAVAVLGHDTVKRPGKGIILRKGVVINSPEDFRGKTLISRRAGPADSIFLREFLESIGLDPERDVTIIDQVPEDEVTELLKKKEIDGGFYHLYRLSRIIEEDIAYLYRKMDWINPEISHALLVFGKDFLEVHPERVKKIIRAYMKRIKYEHSIPEEEKIKEKRRGLQMVLYFQGMNLPQCDYPPFIRLDLLKEVQRLLLKYKFIVKKVNLEEFVNNDFVREVYEELK